MKPRRVPFAVSYIDETVAAFVVAVSAQSSAVASVEIAWANDVLVEYFDIHVHEESVREIKSVFESVQLKGRHGSPRIPYRRDLSILPSVSFDALRALAKRRRSVRWFLPRPVERHLLDQALEVGALGPSACNRQPFQFRFFDDHDLVQKIIGISYGLAGYGHQVPVVAVVVGQQRHFFDERPNSGLRVEQMHGCLPLDNSSGEIALGAPDRICASWTSAKSLADGAEVGDAALEDLEDIDEELELDERRDALDADGEEDMDEEDVVPKSFQDVMA